MRRSSYLFLVSVTALAQQTASLTGKVTNSVTGAPVPRAHVILRGQRNFGALTDGEGKFSITGIVPGGYAYAAERVGFTSEVHVGTPGMELNAGENSLDLKLIPVGSIAGRVLGADGEPVQLAKVLVEGPEEATATTDNKGRYRIGGLRPGKYRVKVLLEPRNSLEIRTDGSKQVHYMSTYYPGVPASKGATRLTIAAGGEVSDIDIPLLSTPIVKVSGKVLDIPGGTKKVSVYAGYELSPQSSTGIPAPVGKDGSFVIWGLDPGEYTLRAYTGNGGNDGPQSAPLPLALGTTDIDHVELRLVPPFDISGHIEYEDERAREASKIVSEASLGPLIKERSVHLSGFQAEIGDDDTFRLEKVQPDRYLAEVTLGHTYVKSVSLGSVESGDGSLDMRNGSGGASLTLIVSAAWGEISGTVIDSNGPVAGARVAVMQARVSSTVQTDSNGHYSVPALRPGTYRLFAGDERVEGLWRDDSELEDYEDALVTVEVHAGDKIKQDLMQVRPDK